MPQEPDPQAAPQDEGAPSLESTPASAPTPELTPSESVTPEVTPLESVRPELAEVPATEPFVDSSPVSAHEPVTPNFFAASSTDNATSPSEAPSPMNAEQTPVVPVVAPTGVPAAAPAKKMKKPLLLGIIFASIAVVLFGGGALAYNFWYQNPEKVVTDAIVHALTSTTGSTTGVLESENDDFKLKISVVGKLDDKVHGSVAVTLDYTSKKDDVTFDAKGAGVFGDNGDLYVKLDNAQELVTSIEEQSSGSIDFTMFEDVVKKIDSKWIKISKSDLGDIDDSYGKTQECVADVITSVKEDKSIRDEISKLYKENRFLVVGDKIGSRTINGQGSLGYKLTGDTAKGKAFLKGLAETQFAKKMSECDDSIDFTKVAEDSADENTEDASAEIWVSRFGHTLTELKLTSTGETKGTFVINPVFNKNETVSIPTDTMTISELKKDIENAYESYYESLYESYYSDYDTTDTDVLFN